MNSEFYFKNKIEIVKEKPVDDMILADNWTAYSKLTAKRGL